MEFQITVKGRDFAANGEREGVYELINGAYKQHRGNGQAGPFQNENAFRLFVQRMLRGER